jgi:hypothetical protein
MRRIRVLRASCAASALIGSIWTTGCGSDTAVGVAQDVATSLSIVVNASDPSQGNGAPLVLEVGDTVSVAAVATNPLGLVVSAGAVAWSSTNTSVAQVDASGLVSATGPGTAEVRAAAGEAASSLPILVNDTTTF